MDGKEENCVCAECYEEGCACQTLLFGRHCTAREQVVEASAYERQGMTCRNFLRGGGCLGGYGDSWPADQCHGARDCGTVVGTVGDDRVHGLAA